MLMSKKTYVGIYAASFGLCLLTITALGALFVFGFVQRSDRALNQAIGYASGFGFFAYLQFVVVHAVYNFVLLARMWRTIQDGQTTVTVRRAIGFLFIPFFNVYWIFRAWGSFPGEYNRYVDRYDLPVAPLPGKIFVAYPILLLLAGILYVPLVALPFVFLGVISKVCCAVNRLDAAVRERRNEMSANEAPNHFIRREIDRSEPPALRNDSICDWIIRIK